MAQSVTNIGDRRPEQQQEVKLPPPEVAVARPRLQSMGWALTALDLGAIFTICYFAKEILIVILISVLVAFILAPVTDLFRKLRMPRSIAAGFSVLLLCATLGAAGYRSLNEVSPLLEHLPEYMAHIQQDVAKITSRVHSPVLNSSSGEEAIKARASDGLADLMSRGFDSATEVVLAASFIPFLAFFMLTWQEHARSATVGLFPLEHRREAHAALGLIAGMVRRFMVGNIFIALMIGAVSTLVFGLMHIPFFYFAGFASGFFSLVPYLGAVMATLPPLFVGAGRLTVPDVGWIVLTAVALHVLAMNVLYPKMLGSRLRLNPLAATIALLVWAWLWGAAGLLLAVPITAGMKIVFDHVESLKPFGAWLGEEVGNGNGNR